MSETEKKKAPSVRTAPPDEFKQMLDTAANAGAVARRSHPEKIAILGYAPSVTDAPFLDPSFHLWGMNDMMDVMPRIDRLFELHRPEVVKQEGHWDRLKLLDVPVVMWQHHADIPTSVAYPLDAVAARFGLPGMPLPYLTCSASEMLAVALLLQPLPSEIHIFGCDMSREEEFGGQRPSSEFYIGAAHALGVKVVIQDASDLCKSSYIYGRDDASRSLLSDKLQQRMTYLLGEEERHNEIARKASDAALQYRAAHQAIKEVKAVMVDV